MCAEQEGYDRGLWTFAFLGPQASDFPLGEDIFGLIRSPPPPLRPQGPTPHTQEPDKPPALADRSRRRTFRSWRGPGERGGGGGVRVGKRSSASPSGHLAISLGPTVSHFLGSLSDGRLSSSLPRSSPLLTFPHPPSPPRFTVSRLTFTVSFQPHVPNCAPHPPSLPPPIYLSSSLHPRSDFLCLAHTFPVHLTTLCTHLPANQPACLPPRY